MRASERLCSRLDSLVSGYLTEREWIGMILWVFVIAGGLIGITIGVLAHENDPMAVGYGMAGGFIGMLAGAVVGFLLQSSVDKARKRASEEEARRLRERYEREQREKNADAMRNGATSSLLWNSERAVQQMESLPALMSQVRRFTSDARRYYDDGAFSPFWSAIEQAFVALASYRQAAEGIAKCARDHSGFVATLTDMGVNPGPLGQFPVSLDEARVQRSVTDALDPLQGMVYEAQKVPVFAQIWEQRRTTAAVVAGFANLEQAVYGMAGALTSALGGLGNSLQQSNRDVMRSLDSVAGAISTASSDQVAAVKQLTSRANAIRDEVYLQGHGRYPIL